MNRTQLNQIKTEIRSYYKSIKLIDVKREFLESDLLNINKKLSKGDSNIFGLQLIPSDLINDSINLCGKETTCLNTCLIFSGVNNLLYNKKDYSLFQDKKSFTAIKKAVRRTKLFLEDKDFFYKILEINLNKFNQLSMLENKKAYFRLNIYSDIDFSNFISFNSQYNFYDYTKFWDRKELPNYNLTYSFSERINTYQLTEKLNKGKNVAIVFNSKKLPNEYLGFKVINGDVSDERFLDEKGVIIGLKTKTTLKQNKKNTFLNLTKTNKGK